MGEQRLSEQNGIKVTSSNEQSRTDGTKEQNEWQIIGLKNHISKDSREGKLLRPQQKAKGAKPLQL